MRVQGLAHAEVAPARGAGAADAEAGARAVLALLTRASARARATGATDANRRSSRSHAVCTLHVKVDGAARAAAAGGGGAGGGGAGGAAAPALFGRFALVDLAGARSPSTRAAARGG